MKPKLKIMKRAAQAVLLAMITVAFTLVPQMDRANSDENQIGRG